MQTLYWILGSIIIGYVLLVLLVYVLQSSMMFHPIREIYVTPSVLGLNFEEVQFQTNDDITLHGWYIPASAARGTVLFSHGNAGNISGRIETIRILHGLGVNILMYDYRGYGKSEESPITEEGTYLDVEAAWEFLTGKKKIPAHEIILMGRSLGGGVTAWLASEKRNAGVILESTFTSAKDLAEELYPVFPVRWLMKFDYQTLEYLEQNSAPVLVLHSREDALIPFHHGSKLFESAGEPKTFFEMKGGHGGGHVESGKAYIETMNQFFNAVLSKEIKESE